MIDRRGHLLIQSHNIGTKITWQHTQKNHKILLAGWWSLVPLVPPSSLVLPRASKLPWPVSGPALALVGFAGGGDLLTSGRGRP